MRTPFPVAVLLAAACILLGDCSREPTPEQKQADSTLVLAKAQLDRGEYRAARASLNVALTLDLRLNRPRQLAEEYTLSGHLSVLIADFDEAITSLTKATEQYRSLADRANARRLVLEVASLHRQMGEEQLAYNMYTEALRLSMVFSEPDGARAIQLAMLPACRSLGHYEEEGRTIDTLLKAYVSSGDQGMQARLHFESALSLMQRQEYPQAVEPLLRALTFADHAKDSVFVIRTLSTLADVYFHSGNTLQAFETYTDALTRSDRTTGAERLRLEMLIRVGNIYLDSLLFSEAGRFYRAALPSAIALKDRLAEGYLFTQLGQCAVGEGRTQEAVKSMQNAIDLFTSEGYTRGLCYATAGMGIACERSGRLNDAVGYFKTAVEHMEHCPTPLTDVYGECEETGLRRHSYYDILNDLLLKLGRTEDAFWYAERKAEHALFEKAAALELRSRNEGINALLAQFGHARSVQIGSERQLAKSMTGGLDDTWVRGQIQDRLRKSEALQEDAAAAIVKLQPGMAPAVQFNGMSTVDAQRLLAPGNVLLRHVATGQAVYSFAVTGSKVSVQLSSFGRDQLRRTMTDFVSVFRQLEALADSPSVQRWPLEQRMQEESGTLYAALIRPVERALAGASKVLILPDQDFPLLPIQALRRGGGRTSYCIEQFPLAYLPSLALLGRASARGSPVQNVVGIGHPGSTSWDVEYELRDIRAFYREARLYFGRQASFASWQRESGDVLHVALDLRYSARAPGNARVVLSDPKAQGIAKEKSWGEFLATPPFPTTVISHLSADSVYLDPLLPSLFLMNGSSAVILNITPAPRRSKKFFGELFYTGLLAGKPADVAFREAQLEMIRSAEYDPPYLWAAFTLWE